jgi:hypothetical protein
MTTLQIVSMIGLLGWLVLVGGALASYRLGASQLVKMALVWLAIFVGGFVVVSWLV